jgi:hypothetical protein
MEIRSHTGGQFLEISVDEKNLSGANRLGIPAVRDAIGHIKAEFPGARVVHGLRISGAKPGQVTGINIDKFPAAPPVARAGQGAERGTAAPAPTVADDFTISGSGSGSLAGGPLSRDDQTEIANLAKKATGWGPSARKARRDLARKTTANPEAQAAAERLGVEVPPDILSDDAQVQSLTGLARSQAGSEAETAWRITSARVSQQADDALAKIGASGDLAQLSDDLFQRLNGTAESIQRQASKLRDEVDATVKPGERVDATNLQTAVANLINDYGGLPEAKAAMTSQEKSLLTMLGEGAEPIRPTYARLNRLRDDIGEALNKGKGPWADVNRKQHAEYYKALADDQLAAVEQMGGRELGDKQRAANTLFSQMYDQRAQMQDLFGKALEKSLAPLLNRAVASGAKGDAKDLTTLLDRSPDDARGGAVLSAIMSQAGSRASHGGFSFANYAKLYRGLRQNSPVYAKIAKAVGAPGERVLRDLYSISNRMAEGETKVIKTGKANQVLSAAMQAEGVVSNILGATASRAASGAGAAVGGVVGGPVGAAAGATLGGAAKRSLTTAGASRLDKVHNLLSSPQFRTLLDRMAGGESAADAGNVLWDSPAFHKLAKSVGVVAPEARRKWLANLTSAEAIQTGNVIDFPGTVGRAFSATPQQLAAQPNTGTSTTGAGTQ